MTARVLGLLALAAGCGGPAAPDPLPDFTACRVVDAETFAIPDEEVDPALDAFVERAAPVATLTASTVPSVVPPPWGGFSVDWRRRHGFEVLSVARTGAGCASALQVPVYGTFRLGNGLELADGTGVLEWVDDDHWSFAFAGDYFIPSASSPDAAAKEAAMTSLAAVVFSESRPELTPDASSAIGTLILTGGPSGGTIALSVTVRPADQSGAFIGPMLDATWEPTPP